MRPCKQCRTPIENSTAECPQCHAHQDDVPRVNTEQSPESGREAVRKLLSGLVKVEPLFALAVFCLPLAAGAAIGLGIGGAIGALIGVDGVAAIGAVIGMIVSLALFIVWIEKPSGR